MTSLLKTMGNFNPLRFCEPLGSSPEDRLLRIQERAYFHASQRQFAPGHEIEDWLAAEHEVDVQIAMELSHPPE